MSMKKIKFTGLLTRKKAVRYLIYILFVCVFAVFVIKLNQVEKTELVVRTGQTFEKAKVVKILQDNLEICRRYGMEMVVPVDDQGRHTDYAGKYAGMKTEESNPVILADMKESGARKLSIKWNIMSTVHSCKSTIENLCSFFACDIFYKSFFERRFFFCI